ncbi:MAG TPA: hypothetical protein VFI47_16390 [Acidimicrobiales bacterium]|nr:hypothetical protein [Acidimicrobiales bacterium]
MELSDASRILAGILLLSLVTVESGGVLLLRIGRGRQDATPLQQSFFRAGHAHAGVYLILGLVAQVLVDATTLTGAAEWVARSFVPIAALLLPGGFFLSVARPGATEPNRLVMLIPLGGIVLAIGLATLGIGLIAA